MTSWPLLPLLCLQSPAPTGVSFTAPSLWSHPFCRRNPAFLNSSAWSAIATFWVGAPGLRKECGVQSWGGGREPPRRWLPASPPFVPPEPGLRRFLGGWLGLAAAAAVLLCHARRGRPVLEGEEGRNLISPVAKGWRLTPSSPKPPWSREGSATSGGPPPRADGKWGGAGGRLGKGARKGR